MVPFIITYYLFFFKGKMRIFSRFFNGGFAQEFLSPKFTKSVDIPCLSVYNETNYTRVRSE